MEGGASVDEARAGGGGRAGRGGGGPGKGAKTEVLVGVEDETAGGDEVREGGASPSEAAMAASRAA